MPDERTPTPRFDTIDLLRGLSILAVILMHIEQRLAYRGFSISRYMPQMLFGLIFESGALGVTVFFSISGFLITLTSIQRFGGLQNLKPRTFYGIRFARIAPLLLALLAILIALDLAQVPAFTIPPEQATLPRALLAALTFHMNWLIADRGYLPTSWSVLWSLSIEEMFYLFFPLACLLLLRRRAGSALFPAVLLGFVVAGPFARTVWTTNVIWSAKSYLSCMDAIALGCLAALLTHLLKTHRANLATRYARQLSAITLAASLLAGLMILLPPWKWILSFEETGLDTSALSLGICLIMIASVLRARPGLPWLAPLRWLGRHSYELYLVHQFVVIAFAALLFHFRRGPVPLWFLVIALATAPAGALVQRFFSEPLNRKLRPRLFIS